MPKNSKSLFKAGHEYKLTFRNGQTNKLSQACSISNTTPVDFIKKSALSAAKAAVMAAESK